MIIDLLLYSVRELMEKKGRTFLTIVSIIISSMFITSFIGAGVSIKKFLFTTIEESAVSKQVIINNNDDLEFSDVDKLNKLTEAKDIRISVIYPIKSITYDNLFPISTPQKIKIYENNYSLITKSELNSFYIKTGIDYGFLNNKSNGVYISEHILVKNKIVDMDKVLGKKVRITVLNPQNMKEEIINCNIQGIIPTELLSILEQTQRGDIFISSNLFNFNPKGIEFVTFDYENYKNIRTIEKKFQLYNLSVVSNSKELLDIETESIIYNTILAISSLIIIVTTTFVINNSLNISFKERIKYFGMLKAMGFNNTDTYLICIMQSFIMSLVGGMIGGMIAGIISKFLGLYIAKSILLDAARNIQRNIFAIQWGLFWYTILILVFSGIIAGIFPALRISRMNPISALTVEK